MCSKLSLKSRKELQTKLAAVFNNKLQWLSVEYRGILLDDLISAFENRVDVLSRVQMGSQPRFEVINSIELEAKLSAVRGVKLKKGWSKRLGDQSTFWFRGVDFFYMG
jgi:hypothetical protein